MNILSPEQTGIREVTLNAGDVLYLPPGVWHEGRTSESHSLHYTLTFTPLGPWQLIVAYLRRSYFANGAMRRDLRYSAHIGNDDATTEIESALEETKRMVALISVSDLTGYFAQIDKMDIPLKHHLLLP